MANEGKAGKAMNTLKTLQAAARGLLFTSESDAPIKAFVWNEVDTKQAKDAVAAVEAVKGVATSAVKKLAVASFFAPMTEIKDWMGEPEKATAAKFAALVDTLNKTLSDAEALRVEGNTTVDAYVIGKDANGLWAGVSTQLVET